MEDFIKSKTNGMSAIRNSVINLMNDTPSLSKLKGEKWYEVEDAITSLICRLLNCKDSTYSKPMIIDIVKSDFQHQLDITVFGDNTDCDNSFHYMMTQLDLHFKQKDIYDNSLTEDMIDHIKTILNVADSLQEAYEEIIDYLNESEALKNLPKAVSISIYDINYIDGETENDELESMIGDYLSDTYGYCHFRFDYDITGDTIKVYDIKWDVSQR